MSTRDIKQLAAKQRAFLAAYRITASITRAAAAAEIERDLHYRWLKDSKEYREQFDQAREEAAQTLEDEAVRRAHEGVFEPMTWKGSVSLDEAGNPVGLQKYSDTLLQFLLKGMRPERYRDNWKGELTIPGGVEIKLEEQKLRTLTDDELDKLIAIAGKLTAARGDEGGTGPARP